MLENGKAPAGATIPAGAVARVVGCACNHHNTLSASRQVIDCLSTGRQNAHTAREIADWTGFKPRDVTRMIERARLEGAPICASCDSETLGYYLTADAEELSDYLRRFKARRRTIARTETALTTTLCAMTGQTCMDFREGEPHG